MKTKLLFPNLLFALIITSLSGNAQVSKSNTTNVTVNGNTATHVINFSSGDMSDCNFVHDLNVSLDWTGGAFQVVEEIAVSIQSPEGTIVHLVYDVQGVLNGDNTQFATYDAGGFATWSTVTTIFDDEGSTIPSNVVPANGNFIPEEALSAFDGENPVGNWTITFSDAVDNGFGDDYTVTSSTIEIACPPLSNERNEFKNETTLVSNLNSDNIEILFNKNYNTINLEVYNMSGQKILTNNYINSNKISFNLNAPTGVYFVKVTNELGTSKVFKTLRK